MNSNEPISLIFLAYNEAKTIEGEILSFYEKVISKLPGSQFIIAEDGSSDGTTEIIKRIAQEKGVIHLTGKERKGYAKALIDAVSSAKNEFVFLSDTGLKHDPEDFWKLYRLRNEYDLIVGRKTNRKDQLYRRILTFLYNSYLRINFKISIIHDADSGFRLFNKKIADEVYKGGLKFRNFMGSEVVLKTILKGYKYCEVPVKYFKREGTSRGVPVSEIPEQVNRVLGDLKRLKKEYSNHIK